MIHGSSRVSRIWKVGRATPNGDSLFQMRIAHLCPPHFVRVALHFSLLFVRSSATVLRNLRSRGREVAHRRRAILVENDRPCFRVDAVRHAPARQVKFDIRFYIVRFLIRLDKSRYTDSICHERVIKGRI